MIRELERDPNVAPGIPRSGRTALVRFARLLDELTEASRQTPVTELLDLVLKRTGYSLHLEGDPDKEDRLENIRELRNAATEFAELPVSEGLATFLEQAALVSDVDNLEEGRGGHNPHHAPPGQRAGVPGGLHDRPGGRAAAPRPLPRRRR